MKTGDGERDSEKLLRTNDGQDTSSLKESQKQTNFTFSTDQRGCHLSVQLGPSHQKGKRTGQKARGSKDTLQLATKRHVSCPTAVSREKESVIQGQEKKRSGKHVIEAEILRRKVITLPSLP